LRVIGIDYGDSRIGIAMSDELGIIAGGLDTIDNIGMNESVESILNLILSNKVGKVVVGFPKNMNNTQGKRAEITEQFIELLGASSKSFEIIKWDERLSSVAATKTITAMGMGKKKKREKGRVDKIAAILILQGYLDSCRN
jgi:putative Holliday junction resolvase